MSKGGKSRTDQGRLSSATTPVLPLRIIIPRWQRVWLQSPAELLFDRHRLLVVQGSPEKHGPLTVHPQLSLSLCKIKGTGKLTSTFSTTTTNRPPQTGYKSDHWYHKFITYVFFSSLDSTEITVGGAFEFVVHLV